ncbi:MAG: hypothetical protein ACM3SM_05865, partial [Bacteroidota bacterium]
MIRQIVTLLSLTSLLFSACQNGSQINGTGKQNTMSMEAQKGTKTTDIAFSAAKNYFVNNTVKNLDNPKIETSEKFNEIFGMAATMGCDDMPTKIDFAKQYVIAVIL